MIARLFIPKKRSSPRKPDGPGFTIVELLIVVVVISVLATVTTVTFGGIQKRARDSRRVTDMRAITKALEMYKVQNGSLPAVQYVGSGNVGGWESSAHESAGEFIKPLALGLYGLTGSLPVDPINNATGGYTYLYYRYGAGNAGCPAANGAYYVIGIDRTEQYGGAAHPDSPGFSCSGRNWQTEFSWVTGGYEK